MALKEADNYKGKTPAHGKAVRAVTFLAARGDTHIMATACDDEHVHLFNVRKSKKVWVP